MRFREGLHPDIQLDLACKDTGLDLNLCISLTIKLDQHLRGQGWLTHIPPPGRRQSSRGRSTPVTLCCRLGSPEPSAPVLMELGLCLSAQERQRRLENGPCLYCCEAGHCQANCPQHRVSTFVCPKSSIQFCVASQLHYANHSLSVSPLIDSGSAGNFISQSIVSMLSVPVSKLPNPIKVKALDGLSLTQYPRHARHQPNSSNLP